MMAKRSKRSEVSSSCSPNIISLHHQLLLSSVRADGPALRIRNVQYFSASHKDLCGTGRGVGGDRYTDTFSTQANTKQTSRPDSNSSVARLRDTLFINWQIEESERKCIRAKVTSLMKNKRISSLQQSNKYLFYTWSAFEYPALKSLSSFKRKITAESYLYKYYVCMAYTYPVNESSAPSRSNLSLS